MDSFGPLQNIDPYPMVSDPYQGPLPRPSDQPMGGLGLHLGHESQIPDHPGSVIGAPVGYRPPRPIEHQPLAVSAPAQDLRSMRASCQFALREYVSLRRRRQRYDASTSTVDLESRIRAQAGLVLGDLRTLQSEVRSAAKAAENHRWRKWFVGGIVASFIPLVRRLFRRETDEELAASSNDTEHAFMRSHSLLSRIKDSVLGRGGLASMAFFVFAVLYIFQNEVTLRVARTVQKRVKKLIARVERGDDTVDESDMKALDGWRWRVLLW